MSVVVDIGQCVTAAALALFGFQARRLVQELRTLRLDHNHLSRWASRKHDYTPREEQA